MSLIIKAHLETADGMHEMRRILVTVNLSSSNGIFEEIATKVGNIFPGLANKRFTLRWRDSDGDYVMMSTDEEMQEAISHAQNSLLKLFITVDGLKQTEDCLDMESDKDEVRGEKSAQESQGDDAHESNLHFMGPHLFRSIPPNFSFGDRLRCTSTFDTPIGFQSRVGRPRKRCHPDYFELRGYPGYPFEHRGPFGPLDPRGHHFSHHGPFGHHMGMSRQFRCHNIFNGVPSPFSEADRGFGHNHRRKKHQGKHGWKANLRDAVPVVHRRWTKAFIRSWRVQNLNNATSTSSDSDQDVFVLETSNIPEAYVKWLETVLPKWHKCLGQDISNNSENSSEDKNKLKASVPIEFRKWTKWYLARHFGKKESPKFRRRGSCHNLGGGKWNIHGKDWKKSCKMQTLRTSIPMMHRMWVKIFIKDWRQEHNIPDPKLTTRGTVSSESEDTEKESQKGDITVPNDYVRWMRKFLARWHYWRGEVEKVEIEKGGMAEFADTVPKNFHKWVQCYMWHRYGNGATKSDREADTAVQYQKWLQAFQRKWLQKQQKENEEVLGSDDETASRILNMDETENTAESLKKLCLEGGEDGSKKDVSPTTEMENGKITKVTNIGDFEETLFHKKMSPGFRHWAKEALWQWDGKTGPVTGQTEGTSTIERVPPHIYKWMSKLMMKMQVKKMKQELKQYKHSMKAAKKAQK